MRAKRSKKGAIIEPIKAPPQREIAAIALFKIENVLQWQGEFADGDFFVLSAVNGFIFVAIADTYNGTIGNLVQSGNYVGEPDIHEIVKVLGWKLEEKYVDLGV